MRDIAKLQDDPDEAADQVGNLLGMAGRMIPAARACLKMPFVERLRAGYGGGRMFANQQLVSRW